MGAVRHVRVRSETDAELVAVAQVVREAFGPHKGVDDLLLALRRSSAWRGLSFVAEQEGVIVGHVCFTRGWLDAPSKLVEVLILSPMSVLPEWQRKGIGTALIKESIKLLAGRAEPLVFLEGNPRFYAHAGFWPASPAGFTAPSTRIPDAAFQFCALPGYEAWMTGALAYPDVFWEMDAVGLRSSIN